MAESLQLYYREQLDMYSPLTQEEVEALYASEGIQDKPISEVIKEIELEIKTLKSQQEESIKEFQKTTNALHKTKYREITDSIAVLEEKRKELQRIQSELLELAIDIDVSKGVASSIDTIDKEIERLRGEWRKLEGVKQELIDKKDEMCRETKEKIRVLEEKLSKIRIDYATVFKQLYSSSRGIIRKKRRFPSDELRNKIVLGHLDLARTLAAKYYKMCDRLVEFDDLQQTAYEALMSAAHYYIPSPRAKFKTYATRCIENKLKRLIGITKKKKRKKPTAPLEFIDKELRKIDYVVMLIDACRNVNGKDGLKYFSNHFSLKPIGIQYRFKQSIRSYNSELRNLGLTSEQLPTYKVKKSESGFQEILNIALTYMKDSKLKVLISPEDFEMASLAVAHENHARDLNEIYELLYVIKLYQKRLKDVRLLLEAEIELARNRDGITPSKEELLEEVNRRIAIENKGIYKARNNPTVAFYKSLHSYYDIYSDMWGVDFFAQGERSRANEIKKLEYDFEDFQRDTISNYRYLINDIADNLEDEIYLFRHRDEGDGFPFFLETWSDEPYGAIEKRIFTNERAIEFINKIIKELESLTREDYVNQILKWRKKETLAELNRLNAEIIKKNRDLETTIRQQQATRYERYWNIENVQDAMDWLSNLYESGLPLGNSKPEKPVKLELSVEDEAIDNLFMTDYLKALESLPPLARDVLKCYYDESGTHSMSAREIAEKLGITEKTVYREKEKAMKLLQKNATLKNYLE